MNFEYFVAKKVAFSDQKSFSGLIIRIAVVGVALSLSVMIIANSLVAGFKEEISRKIFGFWGHIHITHFDANAGTENIPIELNQSFYPYLDTVKSVHYLKQSSVLGFEFERQKSTKAGIKHIQQFANKAGIIKTENQFEGIVLRGVASDFDWSFLKNYLIEGDTLNLIDSTAAKQILISESTAKRLQLNVGDKFRIHFLEGDAEKIRQLTVVGIYKTGLEEYDRKYAIVDIRHIQQLNLWSNNQIGGFEIFIENIDDLDEIGNYIYYDVLPTKLYSQSIKEMYPNIFDWLNLQNLNERVILMLMLIVAIINMITALLILILERTNMIGILKALGNTNTSIRKIFLYYAAYIIVYGLAWGNLIGISLCLIQKYTQIIKLPEEAYYVSFAPVSISISTIIALNLGTLIITLIALILPTLLVTKISPISAIRFK